MMDRDKAKTLTDKELADSIAVYTEAISTRNKVLSELRQTRHVLSAEVFIRKRRRERAEQERIEAEIALMEEELDGCND